MVGGRRDGDGGDATEAEPLGHLEHRRLWRELPAALLEAGPVDRVELKAIVDVPLEVAMAVLSAEVLPPVLRRIHYLDTPDLRLTGRGIVVRVRETHRLGGSSGAEVVVKLRRTRHRRRRRVSGLRIELDALPTSTIWSASSHRVLTPRAAQDGIASTDPAARLLGSSHRRLVEALGVSSDDLADLVVHGPVDVVRLRSAESGNRMGVESWRFPDGSQLVELSVKCRPEGTGRAVAVVRELLGESRIAVSGRQVTKTQFALGVLNGSGNGPLPVPGVVVHGVAHCASASSASTP